MFKYISNALIKKQTSTGLMAKRFNAKIINAKKPITINRELPDPIAMKGRNKPKKILLSSLYIAGLWIGAELIFNNERCDNASVNNTLLELRRNKKYRELLGNNIRLDGTFVPWVYGTLNQVKGDVDIQFFVVGNKDKKAKVFFKAQKTPDELHFNIVHWYFHLVDEPDVKYDLFNGDLNKRPL